jgi:hypothetical protein
MTVNVMQPCPTCKGNKKQVHPLWWALYKRRDTEPELKAADFFLEHHILKTAERPSIIIPCQKCKGTGEVATWVPLKVFLELVHQAGMGLYKMLGGAPL